MIAYLLCNAALARVPRAERRYPMPVFDLRPIAAAGSVEPGELLLTNAERGPPALATPGLRVPIGAHPDGGLPHTSPPDASQDLFAALAELRRDLN
jgi:hypothetical protein